MINIEGKRYYIFEECLTCLGPLEHITNKEGFVIDFWCKTCERSFNLEELRMEEVEIQKSMEEWM